MGLIYRNDPQGSDEWLAARNGVITGSRFRDARDRAKRTGALSAAATGYAMDLARERCGGLLVPVFQTAHMRLGTEQEPAARDAYEIETGYCVEQCGFVHTDDRRFGVSPDGLVGNDGLIEIKTMCSSATLFRAVVDGDVSEYLDQINGEMWLLARKWCDLILWAPDLPRQLYIKRIWRDDDVINALESDLMEFSRVVDGFAERLAAAIEGAS